MNCEDFKRHWKQLVDKTIDASDRGAMVAHARTCQDCGAKLEVYDEVYSATQRIVDSQPLPTGIAEEAADHAYQSKFGAGIDFNVPASPSGVVSRVPRMGSANAITVAWTLGGLVVGYVLGGGIRGGSQAGNPLQQLQNLQMMYGGGRGGNVNEMMWISQMMGANASSGFLPAFNSTIKIVFLAAALMWVARSRLWKRLFPAKLPLGIRAARWMALIAALLGLARCIGYAAVWGVGMSQGMLGGGPYGRNSGNGGNGVGWMVQSLQLVDQLWAIAFWITVLMLVMTVAEHLVQALIPQKVASRKN